MRTGLRMRAHAAGPDGRTCDISAVSECVEWLRVPTCIRSTIPPGTVDILIDQRGNDDIAFSPEYIGEQPGHPWANETKCGFLIIGGSSRMLNLIAAAYTAVLQSDSVKIYHTTTKTAELCKYMENAFLATKVAFVNQFFDIAEVLGVDFTELRRLVSVW